MHQFHKFTPAWISTAFQQNKNPENSEVIWEKTTGCFKPEGQNRPYSVFSERGILGETNLCFMSRPELKWKW